VSDAITCEAVHGRQGVVDAFPHEAEKQMLNAKRLAWHTGSDYLRRTAAL
jgi:hypothetical protein